MGRSGVRSGVHRRFVHRLLWRGHHAAQQGLELAERQGLGVGVEGGVVMALDEFGGALEVRVATKLLPLGSTRPQELAQQATQRALQGIGLQRLCGGQLALRGEVVDGLRQPLGQLAGEFLRVQTKLLGQALQLVVAQDRSQLFARHRQVLARAHPGSHHLAQVLLLKGLHEALQPTALRVGQQLGHDGDDAASLTALAIARGQGASHLAKQGIEKAHVVLPVKDAVATSVYDQRPQLYGIWRPSTIPRS